MTDNELKRLSRGELLEMLLSIMKENENLKEENTQLNKLIESRKISVNESGTLAEAALKLNGVFEAAQAAANQYLDNIRNNDEVCLMVRRDAEKEAERIISSAKTESRKYWKELADKLEQLCRENAELKDILNLDSLELK